MSDMAKAPGSDTEHALNLRVHVKLVERTDGLLDYMAEELGRKVTRSDVWREALMRGLRAMEKARDSK